MAEEQKITSKTGIQWLGKLTTTDSLIFQKITRKQLIKYCSVLRQLKITTLHLSNINNVEF